MTIDVVDVAAVAVVVVEAAVAVEVVLAVDGRVIAPRREEAAASGTAVAEEDATAAAALEVVVAVVMISEEGVSRMTNQAATFGKSAGIQSLSLRSRKTSMYRTRTCRRAVKPR